MTTEQAPRELTAEALELASVLRYMTECGTAPDDLWTRDQPDGDPFVARAAELLEHFARALVASQAQPAADPALTFEQWWDQGMSAPRDTRPLNYDPTDPDKMLLPAGTTCGGCVHIRRCKAIFGHVESDTYCDWSPSRFQAIASATGVATS